MIPVCILTCFRIKALKKLLSSLLKAEQREAIHLFVLIDYPKSQYHLQTHQEIIHELNQVQGFKRKNLIIHSKNQGVEKSWKILIQTALEQYPYFIYLEEDLEVHPFFLVYMTQSILKYQDSPQVYAINGFNLPYKKPPSSIFRDHLMTFFQYRFFPWGFASTRQRFLEFIDFEEKNSFVLFRFFLFHPVRLIHFTIQSYGWTLAYFVDGIFKGKLRKWTQAWDIRFFAYHYFHHRIALTPFYSLTNHWGIDHQGLHQGEIQLSHSQLDSRIWKKIIFPNKTVVFQFFVQVLSRRYTRLYFWKSIKHFLFIGFGIKFKKR